MAGTFVGEAQDEDAFVAIVAASPEEEGEDEPEVRAYLCDGRDVTEWFTGTASGNELDLSSESGARLQGNLTPEASTGTITLEDGERFFDFAAELATGVAGLYNATVSDEGQVRGISETGGEIEGQVADEPQAEGGGYPVSGTITSPDGETQDFEAFASSDEAGEEFRWIVLEDGEVKGASKSAATGSSSGFIDPSTDN